MSRSRTVVASAIALVLAVLAGGSKPASAQYIPVPPSQGIDYFPPLMERAPRLAGMGRLTMVIPDRDNHLRVWDYAGNPAGLLEEDSTSVVALTPGNANASSDHAFHEGGNSGTREDGRFDGTRVGYEVWGRSPGKLAYGVVGNFGYSSSYRPYDDGYELGTTLWRPTGMAVLNGVMPYMSSKRMTYALRFQLADESVTGTYRQILVNSAGEFLGPNGTQVDPPNRFDPDETDILSMALGLGLSYRFAPWLTLAAGGDWGRKKIAAVNEQSVWYSERTESRPYSQGQISAEGVAGPHFRYVGDTRFWSSSSSADFYYTQTQGTTAVPTNARGPLYSRDESGSFMRARVEWEQGPFLISLAGRSDYREVGYTPPDGGGSFNQFLDSFFYLATSDTIAFPDSVSATTETVDAFSWSIGGSWRLDRRTIVGVEYHAMQATVEQTQPGTPIPGAPGWTTGGLDTEAKPESWDVRVGFERELSDVVAGRLGYIYQSYDADTQLENTARSSSEVTLGVGVTPRSSPWWAQAAIGFGWGGPAYDSPWDPGENSQEFQVQFGYRF